MVDLVYKFDEKSYRKCLKRLVDCLSTIHIFLCVHKHIYKYTYINGHQHDHFTPLVLHVQGNKPMDLS